MVISLNCIFDNLDLYDLYIVAIQFTDLLPV